jgi:hypothetical protein
MCFSLNVTRVSLPRGFPSTGYGGGGGGGGFGGGFGGGGDRMSGLGAGLRTIGMRLFPNAQPRVHVTTTLTTQTCVYLFVSLSLSYSLSLPFVLCLLFFAFSILLSFSTHHSFFLSIFPLVCANLSDIPSSPHTQTGRAWT